MVDRSELEKYTSLVNKWGFTEDESANLSKMDWDHNGLVELRKARIEEVRRIMRSQRLNYYSAKDYINMQMNTRGFGNSISEIFRFVYSGNFDGMGNVA